MRDENEVFAEYVKAQGGDREALEIELVGLLSRHAAGVVWETLHQRRPEIINEALHNALQGAEGFKGGSKFSTWFHQIVRNLCFDELRKRIRRREVSLDSVEVRASNSSPDFGILLEQLQAQLSDDEKRLLMYKYQGSEPGEIAAGLNQSVETVKKRWTRLRRKLKELSSGVRIVQGSTESGGN